MKRAWLPVMLVVSFVAMLAGPVPANATTYNLGPRFYNSALPGEAVDLGSYDVGCPDGSVQEVYADVTDASSVTHTYRLSDTRPDGRFRSNWYLLSKATAIGDATEVVRCVSDGSTTRTFESLTLHVVTGNSKIHFQDKVNVWSKPVLIADGDICAPDRVFYFDTYSTNMVTSQGESYPDALMHVGIPKRNSNGDWQLAIDVNPNRTDYGDGSFGVGKSYVIRPGCARSNGAWPEDQIDPLMFTVVGDQYVALGDSYSSGEGSFNYDLGGTACHRSTDSYPYYLSDYYSYDPPNFAACSGAITDDLYLPNQSNQYENAQLEDLSSDTELVTLTIGGNDVGFSSVLTACAHHFGTNPTSGWSCSGDSGMTDVLDARMAALAGPASSTVNVGPEGRTVHSISSVLASIHQASPSAKVLVGGYPHLFGDSSADYEANGDAPGGFECVVSDGIPEVSVSLWDAQWLNDEADALNDVIETAVDQAPSGMDVSFVDAADAFAGHGLCDSSLSYLNGISFQSGSIIPKSESFHPNKVGMQLGYGQAFAAHL